jgi:hypothetical protein
MQPPSSTLFSKPFSLLWAFGRIFLLLAVLFALRHPLLNAIEKVFDIAGITEFVIDRVGTPLTRLILAGCAGAGYFITARVCARIFPKRAYPFSLLIAGLVTAAFIWKAGGSLLVTGVVTLILATNWAHIASGNRVLSRVIAIPPLVGEVFFASRFLDWVGSLLGRAASATAAPRVWPGALIAALALAGLLPGKKLIRYEQALRSGPDVKMFATGDFNDIAFDAKENRLLVTGHGVKRVLGYDVADLKKRPLKADVDTGYAQSFEFDPAHRELFIYNADEEAIYVLDTSTLALKRTIAAPDISPGDPWIRRCTHSDTVVIASEADQQTGNPFVVFDGTSGAVVDKRDLEAGNLLVHPDKPILYANFFRRHCGVVAYDMAKREIIAEAPADARTDRMAFDPLRQELMMASPSEGRVQCFDALTLAPKGAFQAIPGVRTITVDAANDEMLVGSLITGEVALMGLKDREVKRRWYLGPWLRSIVIAPGTGIAYVSSQKSLYELHYARRR